MPRDNDNDNASSRGRRDGPSGGKGRSGAKRGPEKKFAKRGFGKDFAGKRDGERRPSAGKSEGARSYGKKPYSGAGKPSSGDREGRPPRRDGASPRPRGDRPFADRPPRFNRDDRPPRGEGGGRRSFAPREERRGDKRPYAPREDRGKVRPVARFPEKKFGDRKSDWSRDRGERYRDRGDVKPWQKREGSPREERDRPRSSRSRDDRMSDDRPKFGKPRFDKPHQRSGEGGERPRFSRAHQERFSEERGHDEGSRFGRPHKESRHDRPRDDRPRRAEGRSEWQEHPRSDTRSGGRFADRPRRDNEDDSRIFAKRPAFGGRGGYRERKPEFDRRAARDEASPKPKKSGERIAKVVARAGLASRRDAEELILQGRVTVNGRVINSPALDVTANDVVAVDGSPLPARERTRLFLYHKPRGLMTTHADPEGRPTVFDSLPEGLPRLISVGRLDFNTEGLLLLTNDGGLARELELPETGWLRRYRVRAHGEVTQAQLDALKDGVEVDGVKYGPIDATLERDQGANVWLVFAIREGKNREVRNVLAHLGLEVNRLIRVSYGPFQLGELGEGAVDEVKTRVLREQLGDKVIARSGADFALPEQRDAEAHEREAPRGKKPFKPAGKSALVSDRKGRRVLVQRTGSEEARARSEHEASGYGPPRRPKRGYHGKRDFKPRDE
jgi:23S rRNA pseudouridine2605 synthase